MNNNIKTVGNTIQCFGDDFNCLFSEIASYLKKYLYPLNDRTAILKKDVKAFEEEYGKILAFNKNEFCKGNVWVLSFSQQAINYKIDGLLAKALQMAGYNPVIFARRNEGVPGKYFSVFGINDFVYIENFENEGMFLKYKYIAEDLLKGNLSVEYFTALRYKGYHIGKYVLSTMLMDKRTVGVDFGSKEDRYTLKKYMINALIELGVGEVLYQQYQPKAVVSSERGYLPFAMFFQLGIEKGIKSVVWNQADYDSMYIRKYDKTNRHAKQYSLSKESWENIALKIKWDQEKEQKVLDSISDLYSKGKGMFRKRQLVGKKIKSQDEIRRQLGLDPKKKTAVVFSHMLYDGTFFNGENVFGTYEKWLQETIRLAIKKDNINWVVKLHPDYVWKAQNALAREIKSIFNVSEKMPDHIKVVLPDTDINTFSLFGITDYCLTVRGTIGLEMAAYGIPVILAGTGHYDSFGFTINASSEDEYFGMIDNIEKYERLDDKQRELAQRCYYVYIYFRPWKMKTMSCDQFCHKNAKHPLAFNATFNLRTIDDLKRAEDLREFSDWIFKQQGSDYIKPSIQNEF